MFWINVPIAVLVLAVTRVLLPAGSTTRGSVDVVGALTVTVGLGALVFAVVRAPEVGWGAAQTWVVLGAALLLLAGFVVSQARRSQPLVPLRIFRTPNLGAANLAQALLGAAWVAMWFYLNLYLQQVLGLGAFASGAALVPMTALVMVGMVALAPRLIARWGSKALVVAGLLVLAVGLGWLSLVRPDGAYAVDVLPATLVAALGMSLAFIPSLGTAISSAPPQDGGLASGIVNTSYQVGSALGLAAMTAVGAAFGATASDDLVALTEGYSAVFLGAGVVALVAALLSAVLLRTPPPAAAGEPARESETVGA